MTLGGDFGSPGTYTTRQICARGAPGEPGAPLWGFSTGVSERSNELGFPLLLVEQR